MEPRVEYLARSLFRGDQLPSKPASWDAAPDVDRSRYYALAAVALGAIADFDAQRDSRSRARGWLYAIRTLPLAEHAGEKAMQAIVEVQTFWLPVKEWFLGTTVDLSVPMTKAAMRTGGMERFDGDPSRDPTTCCYCHERPPKPGHAHCQECLLADITRDCARAGCGPGRAES